jgi:hypothetical protein
MGRGFARIERGSESYKAASKAESHSSLFGHGPIRVHPLKIRG